MTTTFSLEDLKKFPERLVTRREEIKKATDARDAEQWTLHMQKIHEAMEQALRLGLNQFDVDVRHLRAWQRQHLCDEIKKMDNMTASLCKRGENCDDEELWVLTIRVNTKQ